MNGEIAAANDSIAYATQQVISSNDSDSVIVEKAAKVLPRPSQSDWMRLEWTFFLHYGVNAFRGVEWGNGREDPSQFNPSAFDANQWVSAMKDAGGKMIVLVCKHTMDCVCGLPATLRIRSHRVPGLAAKAMLFELLPTPPESMVLSWVFIFHPPTFTN